MILLSHTRLLVLHFAECFRFYRDVLLLHPHWGDESGTYASFDDGKSGQVILALFQRQEMSATLGTADRPLQADHQDVSMLIFGVEDVDVEAARIQALGQRLEKAPANFPDWGYRGAFLRDPDGNLVELSSGLKPEEWSDGLREANEKWKV